MTFEKLLKMSSKEWQEIPDETLFTLLEPFFIVTRPEQSITKGSNKATTAKEKTTKNTGFAGLQKELMALATKQGIILPSK